MFIQKSYWNPQFQNQFPSTWFSSTSVSFNSFLLHCYHTPKLENVTILAIAFSPNNFEILQTYHKKFFRLSNLTELFWGIGRNYVSIMITILSNITVLVSQTVTCFGYLMSVNHGVNKKAPTFVSATPPSPSPLTQEKKNYKLLLFFRFLRKLSSRLILLYNFKLHI